MIQKQNIYNYKSRLAITLLFSFAFIMFSANTVSADSSMIYVNDSGGNDDWDGQYADWIVDTLYGPKKSIKNATGAVTNGGTVNIADGTYTGENNTNVIIDKNITITGQNQRNTIINGTNTAEIFYIQSGCNVTIQNLTITNGKCDVGGAIYNYQGNLTVSHCIFTSNTATYEAGAIYNSYGNLTVSDSTFTNNHAKNGGAISGVGIFTVNNSTFISNTADWDAGAIYNYKSPLNIVNSTFANNIVYGGNYGGVIYNYKGTLNVINSIFTDNLSCYGGVIYNDNGILIFNNSTFTGNSANDGGVFYNAGTLTVSNSTFTNNGAGHGGVIFNIGSAIINFNRIVENSRYGSEIYYKAGTIDLNNNWWGSNEGPGKKVQGLTVSEWLVLTVTADSIINNEESSTIIVDLLHDNRILSDPNHSELYYHDPLFGHVPDGILAAFATTLGTINSPAFTVNGVASSILNSDSVDGIADISVLVDGQMGHTLITILDIIPPTVTSIDPLNNTKINIAGKVITITFSEPIKANNIDSISVTGPSGTVSMIKSINGNVLTITPTSNYNNGDYTINIPVNAVTDLVGNGLAAVFTSSFTVDTMQPTVSVTPVNSLSNCTIDVSLLSESDATIYYRLNDGSWSTFTGSGSVSISNEGVNSLEVYVVDVAGNPSDHTTYNYTIDKTKPTVTANRPSGTYNTRTVTLSANDNFDSNPVIYYSTNNGVTWNHQTKTVTLNLNQGKTVLMFYAKDAAGNNCTIQTRTYNIDTTAPKVIATSPKNYATGFSRSGTIAIKFSENIKTSINWSKVYVKNLKTGKTVSITKIIKGNMLYIKTNSRRSAYNWYQVYIPSGAVKDSAGNYSKGYVFKFKTGRY